MKTLQRFVAFVCALIISSSLLSMEEAKEKQLVLTLNGGYVGKKLKKSSDERVGEFAKMYRQWEDNLPERMQQSHYDSQLLEQFINATKVGLSSHRGHALYTDRHAQDIESQTALLEKDGISAVVVPELSLFAVEFLKKKVKQELAHSGSVPELQELYHHAIAEALGKNTNLPAGVIKRIEEFEIKVQQGGATVIKEFLETVIENLEGTRLGMVARLFERMPKFVQRMLFNKAEAGILDPIEKLLGDKMVTDNPKLKKALEGIKDKYKKTGDSSKKGMVNRKTVASFSLGSAAIGFSWFVKRWFSRKG